VVTTCAVNSGTDRVVVDARTVGQPLVAVGPELVEGGTTDQAQGRGQVGHAVSAASFTSDPQAGEQVGVDQDTLQLVDTDAPGQPGPGFQCIGQVLAAGAGVDPEPVAGDADVAARPGRLGVHRGRATVAQQVDGVIAVDPTGLSYLLAVTGPATLPDKTQVSGANAVALTQATNYAKFAGMSAAKDSQRRAYLIRAAGKAAGERRLLVWSANPAVQADLAQTSVAGILPTTSAPYVGPSIVNAGGNELDYYLDRSLTWTRTGCGPTRASTVAIKLTNNAPASGLSPYVMARVDTGSYPVKAGDNRLEVSYFATHGH
jgi:hypothetical protein